MNLPKIIALIFGIIILGLIIKFIGMNDIINILKGFNLVYLPIIILIIILDYILAGLNTWFLARSFKKISVKYVIKATFISLVYAVITPGKISDLLMIPLLKKKKLTLSQSTISIFMDKMISLFLKVIFGLIGVIFILKKYNFLFFGIPIITLSLIIIALMLVKSKRFLDFIKKKILRKYSILFKGFSKDFKRFIKKNKANIFYNTSITVIKTLLEALLFYFLFLAFGEKTNFIFIFFIFSLLSIIMLLTFPIGISGLGIRELVGIIVFSTIGIKPVIIFNSFLLRIFLIYIINLATIYIYKEDINILKDSNFFKKLNAKF